MKKKKKTQAKEIGQRIKKCRKTLKLTQEKLEERSGVSQNHISSLERGVSLIGVDALMKLAPALGVSMEYLLTGRQTKETMIPQLEVIMKWAGEQGEDTQLKISRILTNIQDMVV